MFIMLAVAGAGGYYIYLRQSGDNPITLPSMADMPWVTTKPEAPQSKGTVTVGTTKKPNTAYTVPDSLELAIKANHDTVAWLEVPGAEISDSVLQYLDNTFYERRDERKNYDVYGCYFMDYECPVGVREVLEPNTVIYGHSAPNDDPDGKRFSKLFRFADPLFARENPCVYLSTEEERMVWQIFAVFYTDVSFDYIQVHISGEDMLKIADKAKELSLYDYGVEVTAEDKILTLSTCSDRDGGDGTHRFVVMAKLLPADSIGLEGASLIEK